MPVCYKRYMRKWMSERLKRRKKPGEAPEKDGNKAPEPLQPRFYDDEPSAAAEASPVAVERVRAPSRSESEPPPVSVTERSQALAPMSESPLTASDATPENAARPRISRRRRGRGGRGGSRKKPAAGTPAASSGQSAEQGAEEGSPEAELLPGESRSGRRPSQNAQSLAAPAPSAAAAPTLPAQSVATPRPSKGTVVLAIGLPGSGKSSWFKRHNIHPLSSDLLRELLFDDAQEQRFQDLVFSNLRSMLKARLIARRPMNYVDATNLTPHDRQSWIKLAKDYGYEVQGVFFDVPLDVCLERHQRRGRAVPEDVMRKMAGKLKPPTFEEGFSKITVVRVKQKDSV
jgi:predicted kinase